GAERRLGDNILVDAIALADDNAARSGEQLFGFRLAHPVGGPVNGASSFYPLRRLGGKGPVAARDDAEPKQSGTKGEHRAHRRRWIDKAENRIKRYLVCEAGKSRKFTPHGDRDSDRCAAGNP